MADDPHIEDDLGIWTAVTLNLPVTKKTTFYLNTTPRFERNAGYFNQHRLRPGITYRLSDKWSLGAAYQWGIDFERSDDDTTEHRLLQQIIYKHRKQPLKIAASHRFQQEQRWIENAGGFTNRSRYRLQLVRPVGDSGKWSLVASNEIFINLNATENADSGGFDQNRAYLGIRRQLTEKATIDVGYLNQFEDSRSGSNQMNHQVFFGTTISLR